MKKAALLSVMFVLLFACKNKKELKEVESVEPLEKVENIDYASFGMESENLPKGLEIGSLAPQITMITNENKKVSLEDYYKRQPVIVIFYRGYWCPVCSKHLSEFAERAKEIENRGAKLIAISSESYENVNKTREKTKANFTIISDVDGSIMEAFKVNYKVTNEYQKMILEKLEASIAETNATKEAVLPVPATYIINTEGKIVYKQFNPNYKVRASIEDILNNLPQ